MTGPRPSWLGLRREWFDLAAELAARHALPVGGRRHRGRRARRSVVRLGLATSEGGRLRVPAAERITGIPPPTTLVVGFRLTNRPRPGRPDDRAVLEDDLAREMVTAGQPVSEKPSYGV